MKRRRILQWMASAAAILPFERVRLFAQPRELTPEAVAILHDIAPTVLPASLGAPRIKATVDRFVEWTRGYREGVALNHGYGHPRLQKSGPTPVTGYLTQLSSIDRDARAKGGAFSSLDLETRRSILDAAIAAAGVRGLPPRPMGQHVAADLMAFYFRSSDANDECYKALIAREKCRPIAVTLTRPAALKR